MLPAVRGLTRAVSGSSRLHGALPGASTEHAPVCILQSSDSVSRAPRSRSRASPLPPAVASPAGRFPGVKVEETDAQADGGRWWGVRASPGACLVHEAAEEPALTPGGDVSPAPRAHRWWVCVCGQDTHPGHGCGSLGSLGCRPGRGPRVVRCSVVRGTGPHGFEVLPVSQGFCWVLFLCPSLPRVC